jgi:hypothetical protein
MLSGKYCQVFTDKAILTARLSNLNLKLYDFHSPSDLDLVYSILQ